MDTRRIVDLQTRSVIKMRVYSLQVIPRTPVSKPGYMFCMLLETCPSPDTLGAGQWVPYTLGAFHSYTHLCHSVVMVTKHPCGLMCMYYTEGLSFLLPFPSD